MSEVIDYAAATFTSDAPVLMSFPQLIVPKAVMKNGKATGEPKFSAGFEFTPDHVDLKRCKALCMKVASEKWPGRNFAAEAATVDKEGLRRIPTFVFPFSTGDKLADAAKAKGKEREWSRGKAVLTARSIQEPKLSVIDGGRAIDLEGPARAAHAGKFYNGVEVLFQVYFKAYDGVGDTGADGVTAYLNMVVSTNKGAKLSGGGASAAEVFKGYIGTASGFDPTGASLDDEIPF